MLMTCSQQYSKKGCVNSHYFHYICIFITLFIHPLLGGETVMDCEHACFITSDWELNLKALSMVGLPLVEKYF